MKQILLFSFLLLVFLFNLKAQTCDTTQLGICKDLSAKKQYQAAYDCYLQYDNNIYAIYHAALISLILENKKSFNRLSEKLISKELLSPASYILYADLYSFDSTKYLKILDKGLKKYCHDTLLLTLKTNYFITHKNYKKALTIIDELIQYQQTNKKSLYYAHGYVQEMMQEPDLAIKDYEKSIDFDSLYFDAYYNIAVVYYNKAVILYTLANNQITKEDYDKIKIQGDEVLGKAIPYFIRADLLKPDDLTVLKTLKTIYERLRMMKELHEIQQRIQDNCEI
jgi:hypothetical protein